VLLEGLKFDKDLELSIGETLDNTNSNTQARFYIIIIKKFGAAKLPLIFVALVDFKSDILNF